MTELNKPYDERLKAVPNLRVVGLPPCCGNCQHFTGEGDGDAECLKYEIVVSYPCLCDGYEAQSHG